MSLICIIGGLGYIGSHIAISFLENSIPILLIDRASNSVLRSIQSRYPLVKFEACELTESGQLHSIFSKYSISTIIYSMRDSFSSCSTIAHYRKIIVYTNIIEAIRDYQNTESCPLRQLILCSNTDMYTSVRENISFEYTYPMLLYLKEKVFYEYAMSQNIFSFSILRVSTPIGCHPILYDELKKKEYLESHPSLQNNLILYFLYDKPLTVFQSNYTIDKSASVNLVSIVDIAKAFLSCYLYSNEVPYMYYNICNSVTYTVFQWLRYLQIQNKLNDIVKPIVFSTKKKTNQYIDIANKEYDITKAKQQLFWEPSKNIVLDWSLLLYQLLTVRSTKYRQYESMYIS